MLPTITKADLATLLADIRTGGHRFREFAARLDREQPVGVNFISMVVTTMPSDGVVVPYTIATAFYLLEIAAEREAKEKAAEGN